MGSEVKPGIETAARILVVGVGGSGGHAIDRMVETNIKGVEFVAVNTDAQDLHHNKAAEKIHIGKNLTKGLGAGMNPEIGRQAAEENRDEIQEILKGADMIFVTCGMGGGTGTGASPVVAEVAKESGALTVGVVTKPFAFEGAQRAAIAEEGMEQLKDRVDTLVTIPNDRLLQVIDKKTSLLSAFRIVDDILRQGVQGISDLITIPGIVNVDFADVKAIMQDAGSALMGIGRASGENRAVEAARRAINSPLLEMSIDGAKGVLFNVSGGPDMGMLEIHEAANIITENIDPNAKVIFGAVTTKLEERKKGEIKVTVVATGFESEDDTMIGSQAISNKKPFSQTIGEDADISRVAREPQRVSRMDSFGSEPFDQQVGGRQGSQSRGAGEDQSGGRQTQKPNPVQKSPKRINIDGERDNPDSREDEDELEIPAFIRKKMR